MEASIHGRAVLGASTLVVGNRASREILDNKSYCSTYLKKTFFLKVLIKMVRGVH
jgi:hypothetical protein